MGLEEEHSKYRFEYKYAYEKHGIFSKIHYAKITLRLRCAGFFGPRIAVASARPSTDSTFFPCEARKMALETLADLFYEELRDVLSA